MWPFSSVSSLEKSNMFENFTDWHSHILPGVDDGIKTLDDAIEVLEAYEKLGFKKIWLTPHIMEDYPNTTSELKQRFEELKSNYNGSIELNLASENMLDNLFEQRIKTKDFLPIGNQGNHLLIETSYFNPPIGFDNIIEEIFSAGYFPVLAHPERYTYMDKDNYEKLKSRGVIFQMNFISLVGGFGNTARKKAEWLLEKNMVDMVGSDIHRLNATLSWLSQKPKKNKHLSLLTEIAHNPLQI